MLTHAKYGEREKNRNCLQEITCSLIVHNESCILDAKLS